MPGRSILSRLEFLERQVIRHDEKITGLIIAGAENTARFFSDRKAGPDHSTDRHNQGTKAMADTKAAPPQSREAIMVKDLEAKFDTWRLRLEKDWTDFKNEHAAAITEIKDGVTDLAEHMKERVTTLAEAVQPAIDNLHGRVSSLETAVQGPDYVAPLPVQAPKGDPVETRPEGDAPEDRPEGDPEHLRP